ncbi:H(+)/Cl(-) exchange transporter ClcA [bacterium]|nr:H(+)/Cl(-) exchange transporter ClcA [candidate division CSSED10-310 bacterium]
MDGNYKIRTLNFIRERRRHQFGRTLLIGLVAGSLAILFQFCLVHLETARSDGIQSLHTSHPHTGWIAIALFSAAAGAFSVWFTRRYSPESSGSGIPHIKGVLSQVRVLEWKRVLPVKFIAGLTAIGSGFSLGREGPTVQIGASAGGMISDLFKASRSERRHLVACGAGAGLAAAFNAPLAGVIFVIEEMKKDLSPATYGTALIASVTADFIARSFMGHEPSFQVEGMLTPSLTSLPIYIVIGVACGLMGLLFNKSILGMLKRLHIREMSPTPWFGALTGLLVGIFAWLVPEAIGSGHATAHNLLTISDPAMLTLSSLLVLLLVKWLMTVMCYCTGVPGGIFAPILLLGCTLGAIIGKLGHMTVPSIAMAPQAFAVAGMAGLLTAIVRTPITSIILIMEMTSNYEQLFPLLATCMIAYIIVERFRSQPIYDALLDYDLCRQGVCSQGQREVFVIETVVESDAPIVGRFVRSAGLPSGCLIISILRNAQEIIPHGDTDIRVGDQLTLVISGDEPEAYADILKLAKSSG